jgi:tRNA A37 N6-isopentenylltransferase MiaA
MVASMTGLVRAMQICALKMDQRLMMVRLLKRVHEALDEGLLDRMCALVSL